MKLSDFFDSYERFERYCIRTLQHFERHSLEREVERLLHKLIPVFSIAIESDIPQNIRIYSLRILNPFSHYLEAGEIMRHRISTPLNDIKWQVINKIENLRE